MRAQVRGTVSNLIHAAWYLHLPQVREVSIFYLSINGKLGDFFYQLFSFIYIFLFLLHVLWEYEGGWGGDRRGGARKNITVSKKIQGYIYFKIKFHFTPPTTHVNTITRFEFYTIKIKNVLSSSQDRLYTKLHRLDFLKFKINNPVIHLWLRMTRMEMDCNLQKLANSTKKIVIVYSSSEKSFQIFIPMP